jgi:hypothetical protein
LSGGFRAARLRNLDILLGERGRERHRLPGRDFNRLGGDPIGLPARPVLGQQSARQAKEQQGPEQGEEKEEDTALFAKHSGHIGLRGLRVDEFQVSSIPTS